MRILLAVHQFFPDNITDTERFTLNLGTALQKAGHQVRVITPASAPGASLRPQGNLPLKDYIYGDLTVTVFKPKNPGSKPVNFLLKPFAALKLKKNTREIDRLDADGEMYFGAREFLEKESFDFLHILHPRGMTAFMLAAREKKIPYAVTLMDYFTICYRHNLLTRKNEPCDGPEGGSKCLKDCPIPFTARDYFFKRRAAAREILSQAAFLASSSKYIIQSTQKEFPHLNIKFILHGIDHQCLPENRRSYHPRSPLTFGYMGPLAAHNGIDQLIEAFKKIGREDHRLKIHGLGADKKYRRRLQNLAGEDGRIEFCGPISLERDAAHILENIDVLCFPNINQGQETYRLALQAPFGFGFIVQEALTAKVPVIVAPCGTAAGMTEGENKFIFDTNTAGSLYQVMDKLSQDPTIINTLKKKITPPRRAEEEAAEYEEMYKKSVEDVIKE